MATLTLEIPNRVYKRLLEKAKMAGQTPEQIALNWVQAAAEDVENDPLLQLAGVLHTDVTDISERHDEYIGQELSADHA